MTLREQLKAYMAKTGMNAADMARFLELPKNTVGDIVRGSVTKPSKRTLRAISAKIPQTVAIGEVAEKKPEDPIKLFLKIYIAQNQLRALQPILEELVFQGTKEEREQFRCELGELWPWVQGLVRALTSEGALVAAGEDGELDHKRRPR